MWVSVARSNVVRLSPIQPRIRAETLFEASSAMPRITLVLFALIAAGLLIAAQTDHRQAAQPTPGATEQFISVLAVHDLSFEQDDSAVAVGMAVCDALDKGVAPSHAATLLVSTLPMDKTDAQLFILTSVDALCPRNRDR